MQLVLKSPVVVVVWTLFLFQESFALAPQDVPAAPKSSGTGQQQQQEQQRPRVAFRGLEESQFRHPLDQDLTLLVQSLPGGNIAEAALRRLIYPVVEESVRLDFLSSSIKVSKVQLPGVYKLLEEACEVLDFQDADGRSQQQRRRLSIPELYVQSNPQANAYTLALRDRRGLDNKPPIIVVTSALLDRCNERGLQSIIGHELGHLKCEHALYLTLGNLASAPLRNLPFAGVVGVRPFLESKLQEWRLAAEYTCDRASLLVAQGNATIVASALLKLFAGTNRYGNMNVDAFVAQCVEYDTILQTAHPLVKYSIAQQVRTHPLPVRRVAELLTYAASRDFLTLLNSGVEF